MDLSVLAAYLVTVTVLILLPGPDMLFALATGIKSGSRAGFFAAAGAAAGEVVHITAAALGLAAVFRSAPVLYELVRFAGAAYLLYLGIHTLLARDDTAALDEQAQTKSAGLAFRQGAVTNLLNPKMALFTIGFLPQFVDTSRGNVAFQFFVLGTCFVVLEILVDGSVGIFAGRFRQILADRRASRRLHLASGSVLVGLGAKVALDR